MNNVASRLRSARQNGPAMLVIQKRFSVMYMGFRGMDRRFSESTMPWVMTEIRQRENLEEVGFIVHGSSVAASKPVLVHNGHSASGSPRFLFEHKIKCLSRFARLHSDPCCFGYLRRVHTPTDHYECHVFMSLDEFTVEDIFAAIRNASRETCDLNPPLEESRDQHNLMQLASHAFYEVLYIGRAKVTKKCLQSSDIDELVDIIYNKVVERNRPTEAHTRHTSGTSADSLPCNLDGSAATQNQLANQRQLLDSRGDGESAGSSLEDGISVACSGDTSSNENITEDVDSDTVFSDMCHHGNAAPKHRNRTMLLRLSQDDIALISPDTKTAVMDITFQDIAYVSQGKDKADMFGFVARDRHGDMVCHILQCCEKGVVGEIMKAFRVAFKSAYEINKVEVCSSCPLQQFHNLCRDIRGLASQGAYEVVVKRIQQLPVEDIDFVLNSARDDALTYSELFDVVMINTRCLCEIKQTQHTHTNDSHGSHKSQFSLSENKSSKLNYFRNRAKKSLTTSFETILGHKKPDDAASSQRRRHPSFDALMTYRPRSPLTKEPPISHFEPPVHRPRSNTMGSLPDDTRLVTPNNSRINEERGDRAVGADQGVTQRNRQTSGGGSPLKHIFMMTGSCKPDTRSPLALEVTPSISPSKLRPSWRQAIFNHVSTPLGEKTFSFEPVPLKEACQRTGEDYRALWNKAILETIFLIRMEKENLDLKARQDESRIKQQKLEYDEVLPPNIDDVTKMWDDIFSEVSPDPISHERLKVATQSGVPRHRRGSVWQLLIGHHQASLPEPNDAVLSMKYEDLLRQLTTHQHSILIDLGRTFPGHPYFSNQLGSGQLALFNILKAYSLLDKEVGYCQGLSFVAGMLLMHVEELNAFECLRYVMFHLHLRDQYKPNMLDLQTKLYQLTRLLHDHHKDLYDHFETHEIVPTMYAAPWFLTLFASQFPLGFVARVFDLLLLDGLVVVFKVALVLLGDHKELIKQCTSFEAIVLFIKTTLPDMATIQTEKIVNTVFGMEISQQLAAYEVEYHVLQDEMITTPTPSTDNSALYDEISAIKADNLTLKRQNMELVEKLQHANGQIHCLDNAIHQLQTNEAQLKSRLETLELERSALLDAFTKLKTLVPLCLESAPNEAGSTEGECADDEALLTNNGSSLT